MRTSYRLDQYVKAGLVFAATTATYFFARATGVFPSWFHWEKTETNTDVAVSEPTTYDFSLSDLSVADIKENNLLAFTHTQTELAGEQSSVREQYPVKTGLTSHRMRRSLLQKSSVSVVKPIPNQVIAVNQQYTYSLNGVFSGNYSLLGALETGKNSLPDWLSLQPELLSTLPLKTWVSTVIGGVVINGSTAFVATGEGLNIVDISNPASPRLLSALAIGVVYGLAVSGNTAFLATGNILQLIDVSNLHDPKVMFSFPVCCPGTAYDVAVNESTAFIAADNWLQIVDVTNTSSPRLISSFYAGSGNVQLVAISGSTVFIGDSNQARLQLVDVSDLNSPHLLSILPGLGTPAELTVFGNTVFFAGYSAGLQIINVSNLSNPVLLSSFSEGLSGRITRVTVKDNTAFACDFTDGLKVIDLSNLSDPYLLSSLTPVVGGIGIAVSDNMVFIMDEIGLRIIDVSRGSLVGSPPISPDVSFSITVSARNMSQQLFSDSFILTLDQLPRVVTNSLSDQSVFPGSSLTLSLNAAFLFVNPGNTFLELSLKMTNKDQLPAWLNLNLQPLLLSTFFVTNAQAVTASGNTVFVVGVELQVIDVTNPSNPRLLSSFPNSPDGFGYGVAVNGTTVFVADAIGLQIIDISNPSSPYLLSFFRGSAANSGYGAIGVVVRGNTAFFADSLGLQIIDVSVPSNPRLLSSFNNSGGDAYGVAIMGNTAFVADNPALQIIDIQNLSRPVLLSYFPVGIGAYGIAVRGNHAYIADSDGGELLIIDVSNFSNPYLVSSLPNSPGGEGYGIAVSHNIAFVADWNAGLQLVDIHNSSAPKLLSLFSNSPGGYAYDIAVSGGTAFVADGPAGLQIIDLTQWQLTANPQSADVGNYILQLTATDDLGGSVSTQPFTFRVEGPPQIHGLIPTQYAKVNQAFNYFVLQGLITDPNFDPITFIATLMNNQSLPAWLQFNAISATFSGTPQSSDVGNYTIVLSATDHIAGAVNTSFTLLINNVPALNQPISSQLSNIGSLYQLTLPTNTFSNPNSGALIYFAQQSNGLALPAWLTFNATQRSFRGLPQSSDVGRYGLSVVAIDQYNGQATAPFILLVEYPPQVNQRIASKFAGVNAAFIYPISANTFIDPSGNSLIYSATQLSGAILPNWLSFNPETLIFSGTPSSTNIGILEVELTATNLNGGQAQQNFNMTVTYFPQIGQSIPMQLVDVGSFYELVLPNTTFTDPDDPVLIYSAQWSGHSRLPQWLNFNRTLLQFTGTPNTTDTGEYDLSVSASDTYGATATASFTLVVDHFPRLNRPVAAQLAGAGLAYSLAIPPNTFIDADDDLLTYQIQSVGSVGLPHWLSFNPQTLVLTGVPQVTDLGDLTLDLTATDPQGGQAQQNFNLSVIQFPVAAATIPDQLAGIGFPYQLMIAGNTFQYPNLTALTYFAQQSDGAGLPAWLQFNTTALKFQGTPNMSDAGLLTLAVIAANHQGGQAQVNFTLRVEAFPRVNQPILAQLAGVNLPFILNVPTNTFLDNEDDSLVYQASQTNGAGLPNWLSFNPFAFSFSGVPQVTDLAELILSLKAIDPYGGWAQQSFNLTVIYFPKLAQPLIAQLVDVGVPYQWVLPNTTFQDPGGRALSYSTQQKNGLPLPGWLQFNASSLQFLGLPTTADVGSLNVMVIAQNSAGAQATGQFTLQVEHFPQWQPILSDQWAGVGVAFSFTLPADTVVDLDNEPLVYQASTVGRSPLPNWLSFNQPSLTFLGVPLQINLGALPVLLTVTDPAGASVTGNFTINVIYFPTVAAALPAPSTVWSGQNFTYAVPADDV